MIGWLTMIGLPFIMIRVDLRHAQFPACDAPPGSALLSLALNLVLTGIFILAVKRLLRGVPA